MDSLDAKRAEVSTLPVIDLARLQHADPAVSQAGMVALRAACAEIGFFYLVGHEPAGTGRDSDGGLRGGPLLSSPCRSKTRWLWT